MLLSNDRGWLAPRTLYALLTVSILTNAMLLGKLYYRPLMDRLVMATQAPPVATPADHVRGNPDAPNTVIVYMDYQCPFCAQLHTTMLELVQERDVRWIYRHFPIAAHPFAQKAAEAAECSGAQGKFWEYSDVLFSPTTELKADSNFASIAQALGLDGQAFARCLSSGQFKERVSAQQEDGIARRMIGTPTFFLNGKRFNGLVSLDDLRKVLPSSAVRAAD